MLRFMMLKMKKEPLSYTRAVTEKLQRTLSRFAFIAGIVIFAISLLYYGYSIYFQISTSHYITLGIYVGITLVSIAAFVCYVSKRHLKELEKRHSREKLREIFSWILIGLRAFAVGVSFYQVIFIGVTDFDKVVSIAMLILAIAQALFEWAKSFTLHYLDLYRLALERDKETLGDDVKGAIGDYVKESIANKFKKGTSFLADKMSGYQETEPEETGKQETRLNKELEEAHADFTSKRVLKKAQTARLEKEDEKERNEKRSEAFLSLFQKKEGTKEVSSLDKNE